MHDINAFFAEVRERAESLKPYSDGGIYLMSLTNKQRGTIGGQISVLAGPVVAATHCVNQTHREATVQEIEEWKKTQLQKAQQQRDESVAKQMRYNLVINAPNWRPGEPMPVDLAGAAAEQLAPTPA